MSTDRNEQSNRGTSDEKVKGHTGREAHGGDVAPPNDDQAGQPQSPQTGTPVKH